MYKSAETLVSRLDDLLPEQKKKLEEFHQDNLLNGLSPRTCENKLLVLVGFCKSIKKPFNEVTKADIKKYLLERKEILKPSSLSINKSILKNFFKWFYNSDDYPEVVRWVRTSFANSGFDFLSGVLNPNEIILIIEKAEKVQHKAIIATLYDSAVRVGELVGMNINDVEFDNNGASIIVCGKTGRRICRFIHSLQYLSKWLDIHPYKDKLGNTASSKKYPLWVSESTPSRGERMSIAGVYGIIKYASEDANIKKKVSPHKLRHARLTDLAKKGLNEPTLKVLAG